MQRMRPVGQLSQWYVAQLMGLAAKQVLSCCNVPWSELHCCEQGTAVCA